MQFPNQYDGLIQSATGRWPSSWGWLRLKAQLFQESQLKPDAQSAAGAQGIAQFMPGTWAQMVRDMGMPASATPFNPEFAIPAAAFYMNQLQKGWTAPRTDYERWRLSLATYNTGMGNMQRAQRISGGMNDFASIMAYLPEATGYAAASETRTYVDRIEGWHTQLVALQG